MNGETLAAPGDPDPIKADQRADSERRRRRRTVQTAQQIVDWFIVNFGLGGSPSNVKERRRVLGLFCARFGERRIDDLRPHELLEYLNAPGCPVCIADSKTQLGEPAAHVKHKGRMVCSKCGSAIPSLGAAWTLRRWLTTIRAPFNRAHRLGKAPINPFIGLNLPPGQAGRDMTDQEWRALLRLATPAFRRLLCFLWFSGARPGEAKKSQWEHVNLSAGCIILKEHKTAHALKVPKPRRIILNSVLIKLLCWIRRHQLEGTRFIFSNSYGQPWTTRALCKNMSILRKQAELPANCKLYGTRHHYACNAVVNQVDIATLMELMGHQHIATTQHYLHIAGRREHLNRAAERAIKRVPDDPGYAVSGPRRPDEREGPIDGAALPRELPQQLLAGSYADAGAAVPIIVDGMPTVVAPLPRELPPQLPPGPELPPEVPPQLGPESAIPAPGPAAPAPPKKFRKRNRPEATGEFEPSPAKFKQLRGQQSADRTSASAEAKRETLKMLVELLVDKLSE